MDVSGIEIGCAPTSKVYVGTGYDVDSIPSVTKAVAIADCNQENSGVCIVGDIWVSVLIPS